MSTIPIDAHDAQPGESVLYLTVALAFLPDGEAAGAGLTGAEPGVELAAALVDVIRRSCYVDVMAAAQARLIGRAQLVEQLDTTSPINTATPEQTGDPS